MPWFERASWRGLAGLGVRAQSNLTFTSDSYATLPLQAVVNAFTACGWVKARRWEHVARFDLEIWSVG